MSTGPVIRTLARDEVSIAIEWAAREGWNPGLSDARTFYMADPSAFMGAFVDDSLAAVISVTQYGEAYAFLGFYICEPAHRGKGIGLSLWHAALAKFENTAIGLDGVVEQQENYRSSGFELAHNNTRYGGYPSGSKLQHAVRPLGDFSVLENYDAEIFGVHRPAFLSAWLQQPQSSSLCVIEDGSIRGWGLIRPCLEGSKIGPLYADTSEIAESLFCALAEQHQGPVFVDPPEDNEAAITLMNAAEMTPVFSTARMYRGTPPLFDVNRTFGITSFEFG